MSTMTVLEEQAHAESRAPQAGMRWIEGRTFRMGSDEHYREEAPAHNVTVDGFWIDPYAVTNEEFARFVAATGHVTLAEQPPDPAEYPGSLPEMLHPASVVFHKPPLGLDLSNPYLWWRFVPGADWRHPQGPHSTLNALERHPVVHIAYQDAIAYANWAGKELPTEAEWELAARGGSNGGEYAWGDALTPGGRHMANTWQGTFPHENSVADGYEWTSPVGSFPPNEYGLYDMIGNVWEWTQDWYHEHGARGEHCCARTNPRGGTQEQSFDLRTPAIGIPRKVIKGGSFLCAHNYCRRYRPAARMSQPIDTSTCHVGFRCVVRRRARTSSHVRT